MKISFAKLGIEEYELCDEQKIHLQGKIQSHSINYDETAVVRKKLKKLQQKIIAEYVLMNVTFVKGIQHIQERDNSRKEYKDDKEIAKHDKKTVYLSADLQKVILLPRLPGYKRSIFTSRLITFNMTFSPIGDIKKAHNSRGLGFLWHEGISGRKDENISSAYYNVFFIISFVSSKIG